MSLYGQLIKQEADYTTLVDEKLIECEKIVEVWIYYIYIPQNKQIIH